LGVKTAPDLGDTPEILAKHLFADPDVNWANSTIRAFGRTYEGVTVMPAEQARDIDLPQPAQAKKQGRPQVLDKVREVVRTLKEAGQLHEPAHANNIPSPSPKKPNPREQRSSQR
jgi:hypothetical protein